MRGGGGSTNCLIQIFRGHRHFREPGLASRFGPILRVLEPANSEPRELVSLGFSGFDSIIRVDR